MALSTSPLRTPGNLKRRSTGAETNHSGSLDYYWSAVAGVGPSSSTSSLAISPSPSAGIGLLSPTSPTSPTSLTHLKTRSATDLRAPAPVHAHHGEEYLLDSPKSAATDSWTRQPLSARSADSNYSIHDSYAGSSKRPKELLLSEHKSIEKPFDSPSSDASAYSSVPSPLVTSIPQTDYAWHYAAAGDSRRPLMDPTAISSDSAYSEHTARFNEMRESVISGGSTAMQSDESHFDPQETPIASQNRFERVLDPPAFNYDAPRRGMDYTTTPSRQSEAHTRASSKRGSPGRHSFDNGVGGAHASSSRKTSASSSKAPSSAPPWQTEFGGKPMGDPAEDDTLKASSRSRIGTAPTSLAPSPPPTLEKIRRGSDNSTQMLSPDRPEVIRRSSSPGEGPSPSLPPRSALRGLQLATIPTPPPVESPPSQTLPTITHTPVSPRAPQQTRERAAPSSVSPVDSVARSAVRGETTDSASVNSGTSIAELTGMLEGAIDEMGLNSSQGTPPPTNLPPKEKEKEKSAPVAAPAPPAPAEEVSPRRRPKGTHRSSSRSESNESTPPAARSRPTGGMHHTNSSISLRNASLNQGRAASPVTPTAQPWPPAMLSGSIRTLKFPGDRAKGYAKAINELSRSESGLREWCIAASSQTHRAPAHTLSKQFTRSSLGRGSDGYSTSTLPGYFSHNNHPRNVSSGSEFPMRENSYAAQEITQRTIDPSDQPTSLPANLPYPQLQPRSAGIPGGMKPSASMASMASTASHSNPHKKGFFSAIRKGKKDSVSSLGPPNPGSGVSIGGNGTGSTNTNGKKDIRNLSIGAPEAVRTGAPMGPRDQYTSGRGSYTPPPGSFSSHATSFSDIPRGSLDTGISRLQESQTGRGSFESTRTAKSTLGVVQNKSPLIGGPSSGSPSAAHTPQASGHGTPRDEEVQSMADVLPHVERGVLRLYLGRYGDSMRAIGAYLEDEKRGAVMKLV